MLRTVRTNKPKPRGGRKVVVILAGLAGLTGAGLGLRKLIKSYGAADTRPEPRPLPNPGPLDGWADLGTNSGPVAASATDTMPAHRA